MSRKTFLLNALADLTALLNGERVEGLSLNDVATQGEAEQVAETLRHQARKHVTSLPLSPVWTNANVAA